MKISADGKTAYVTERAGDLVEVSLSSPNRADATVVVSGMNSPQQLFLDEANHAAYTVEYATSGKLWRIDLTAKTKTAVLSGLVNAVGVVLSADRQTAYISEQGSGSSVGNGYVTAYQLSNGAALYSITDLEEPFFLSWLDQAETILLVPERDPANRLRCINVLTKSAVIAAQDLPTRPSSAAVSSPGTVLVCCNDVIDEIRLQSPGNQADGNLLESIGWVPFDWITAAGLADTTSNDSAYFYQVHDAPFGGALPVMVNFAEAAAQGASYYQVLADGVPRTDVFHGAIWNGAEHISATNSPQTVGHTAGLYTVWPIATVENWTVLPGCYLDSTNLTSAKPHNITVELFDSAGVSKNISASVEVYIDNNPCTAQLQAATFNGAAATACGYLSYSAATKGDSVEIAYRAAQPEGYATFALDLVRGVTTIAGAASGSVTSTWADVSQTAAALLGTCSIAAFAVYLDVWAEAQTGWGRCGQYDASAAEAFMLVPTS